MTPDQTAALIDRISYADPRLLPADGDEVAALAAMWAQILADVPAEYAAQAAAAHYARSPYTIKPSDIALAWRAEVGRRMAAHTDPLPAADPDDEAAYRDQLRAGRRSVATGRQQPAPVAALAPVEVQEDDIAAMRQQGDLRQFIRLGMAEGREKAEQRRRLILRHPDLAQKLTEPPFNYQRPEQWAGGVPPETWNGQRNDSPLRPATLALLAEAQRREQRREQRTA